LFACLSLAISVSAQEYKATPPSEITQAIKPFVDEHSIAGCIALVADKDKILALEPVGLANIETGQPMKPDTLFKIASMSKAISCATFMVLVDEGKVKPTDPVEKYFPEFKGQKVADASQGGTLRLPGHPITLKECMTHTAGLDEKKFAIRAKSLHDDIAAFGKVPLVDEPGKKYKYNLGIEIVSGVVASLSGTDFPAFMEQHLLEPLEMKDTGFFPNQEQVDRLARTVKWNADKTGIVNISIDPQYQSNPTVPKGLISQAGVGMVTRYQTRVGLASGGLFSTVTDVMQFCQMLLNDGMYKGKRVLSPAAVKEMTSNQIPGVGNYGYGFRTYDTDRQFSPGSFAHRGAGGCSMSVDKKRGLVMVFAMQHWDLGPNEDKIQNAFIDAALKKFGKN
jgi:CubicO group peptidase (beta-lactamase class C family)